MSRAKLDTSTPIRSACLLYFGLLAVPAHGDVNSPGKETVQRILLEQSQWVLRYEITSEQTPGPNASNNRYEFFLRDGTLMGRFPLRPPEFECARPVTLRDDGFNFTLCGYRDQPETEVDYDPNDAKFPFKRLRTPSKWWFGR